MELAMAAAPRVLLPRSRLPVVPKPILTGSLRCRPKQGLVRSSSNSNSRQATSFWTGSSFSEDITNMAIAEKKNEEEEPLQEEPVVQEEEVSVVEEVKEEEVSAVEEVKEEEDPVVEEVKAEVVSSEEVSEGQNPAVDFFNQLGIDLDSEDKSKLYIYGGGALTALWILTVVVSAVDSIPLLPKLMEVVGLGYSVWFTSRYILFKENRDELFAKINEFKDQIF